MATASDLSQARAVEQQILHEAQRHGYSDSAMFAIKLALEEGLNNAIRHGHCGDPGCRVEVDYEVNPDQACITITDQGPGFDPSAVPDPTADENLEKPCGRGIMLMRAYMDEVKYNERGNQVRLVKRKS